MPTKLLILIHRPWNLLFCLKYKYVWMIITSTSAYLISYLGKRRNNGHLAAILIFLASIFSPGLSNLDCFQAREFAVCVGALGSLFPDNIIDRKASSVILDVPLSLGYWV